MNTEQNILSRQYQQLVVNNHLQNDDAQLKVIQHLQQLLSDISIQASSQKQSILSRLFSSSFTSTSTPNIKNLYIFGDVGRGKTMLMDLFYEACPQPLKKRVHFHAFMQEVHEYIYQWRKDNEGDPLPSLALTISQSTLLLCFDEFHVTDIADAMLLARLFTRLFNQSVVCVFTSNQHPDDLYKNGLQRELFVPFIGLLKDTSTIVELAAQKDYRLSYFKSLQTVFYLDTNGSGNELLKQRFDELTNKGRMEQGEIAVKGRIITFSAVHGDILFSSFLELCNRPLGPADYLVIANEFTVVLLAGVPILSKENRDQARRFVTLIDALYENKVKLICTIAVPLDQLHLTDSMFDFKRTKSRLIEMQSEKYFHQSS